MELIYMSIGFSIFWVWLGLVSLAFTVTCILYANRTRKIIQHFGKNPELSYIHCFWITFRNTVLQSSQRATIGGLYFPFIGDAYYSEYYEDEDE